MNTYIAAVDLGASSGRVLLAAYHAEESRLKVEEIHRFSNGFIRRDGQDCWDVEDLVKQIETGLEMILDRGIIPASVGIDTWGVDFVLLDADGRMLGQAVSYRDHRTDGMMEKVFCSIPREALYARSGIQFMQFNTIYQLAALRKANPSWLPQVDSLLMMADYLHYRLCGVRSCEYTNASTSQLLNLQSNDWDDALLTAIDIPHSWFLPLSQPGTPIGEWVSRHGCRVRVITPATHDTASAVIATPLQDDASVYISSGTWSLMGIESERAFNDAAALAANFTNEGGSDGRYRVLKNIMGLWLIQRVRNAFDSLSFADLEREAKKSTPFAYLINPNDARFLNPPSMVEAIRDFCRETGQGSPESAGEFARCVFESLAFLYRHTLNELSHLRGKSFARIHIVGGGSKNIFLNQLCADFCQLPVLTGPIEASALGNITCQLRALGLLADSNAIRALIRKEFAGEQLIPNPDPNGIVDLHWSRFLKLVNHVPAERKPTLEGAVK